MNLPESLKHRLTTQHFMLNELLDGLSKEEVHREPQPGKWSIHQQVAHLAIYQPVFAGRMRQVLNENQPRFERYNADVDKNFIDAAKHSIDVLKSQLFLQRKEIISLFNSLSSDHINRAGVHPVFGPLTMEQWAQFFVLHESHHQFSVFRIRNTKG